MAITCPVDLDTGKLRDEIRAIYARVASDPSSEFHFHRGPAYAAERLGYAPPRWPHSHPRRLGPLQASQTRFGWPHSQQARASSTLAVAPVWT
jgi:hypothetical protein